MDNQQDVFDAILGVDDDFLPDGWDGQTDIFTADGKINDAAFGSDGSETDDGLTDAAEDGGAEDGEALTTGDDTPEEAPDQDADDKTENTPADEPEEQPAKPSRKLKLKVNHKEEELDIDAMSDDDLTALLQKGRAFDVMKDAENKRKYREAYQEQVDAGMTDAVARFVAQQAADGKTYSLEDEEQNEEPPASPEVHVNTPGQSQRDLVAEVTQLRALFPEVKEIPNEVAKAVAQGAPLLNAYMVYRDNQNSKTADALRKENKILKQNAAAAKKAPVTGVTGGGDVKPKKIDPALAGWDDAFDGGW